VICSLIWFQKSTDNLWEFNRSQWYGFEKATEITDSKQLKELVRVERDKLLKERDMESVYEQVNNEY